MLNPISVREIALDWGVLHKDWPMTNELYVAKTLGDIYPISKDL